KNTEQEIVYEDKETTNSESKGGKKKQPEIVYEDREALDAQLSGVIADILSAEREAKHIIAKAEENAKAVQLDGATRARNMREVSARTIAEAKAQLSEDAVKRAAAEREKRVEKATANGEKLVKEKEKEIAKQIDVLFKMLGGKA
ncbi:MAG: hypothetical protein K2I75_01775, partial [Clostridiales bacterium]|nr:hypothetical protein [Clostridiales bacterium]